VPVGSTLVLTIGVLASSAPIQPLVERMTADVGGGKPLVAHVIVALCDNDNQGIVPVPRALGNGQDPAGNLYWGARYGVRTYLSRESAWRGVRHTTAPPRGVLERQVFRSSAGGASLFVVADAWDGSRIREAIAAFLESAAGRADQEIDLEGLRLHAGGQSHLVAFVGHNGLMDFSLPALRDGAARPARAAMVLACASQPYFGESLERSGAYPLLMTTGLMAPEAYSLEAAIRAWFSTRDPEAVRNAAAAAYDRHQKCGASAARRLFAAGP
jgi:hypothetical protein